MADHRYMPHWPLSLRRAHVQDMQRIVGLIEDAAGWLKAHKDTDQWAVPWPNRADRDSRILASLRAGKTWICWDRQTPAATITADPDHDPYWEQGRGADGAIYVHRLVVARSHAGHRLGAALLDWAGRTARLTHDARWIRVSAWTTNLDLHSYYLGIGFISCGFHPDDGYPSAARFEKPTDQIPVSWPRLFTAPESLSER
jgi:GNAT superfamily N-acetyltransferase